jgi:hypothetical protein
MKTWFIALPFLFAANIALAADPEPAPAATPMETDKAQTAPQAQKKMTARDRARLHQRDMRHCLDKKTNKEVHRCAIRKRRQ